MMGALSRQKLLRPTSLMSLASASKKLRPMLYLRFQVLSFSDSSRLAYSSRLMPISHRLPVHCSLMDNRS